MKSVDDVVRDCVLDDDVEFDEIELYKFKGESKELCADNLIDMGDEYNANSEIGLRGCGSFPVATYELMGPEQYAKAGFDCAHHVDETVLVIVIEAEVSLSEYLFSGKYL